MRNAASKNALASCRRGYRPAWPLLCLVAAMNLAAVVSSAAETLPEALVKAYQSNPALNADRARQRNHLEDREHEGDCRQVARLVDHDRG